MRQGAVELFQTAAIDASAEYRKSAPLNLGIKAQYSTLHALENFGRLDSRLLCSMLVRHSSGLSVLAAPGELLSTEAPKDAIDRLLGVARQEFDYVVVDAGSRLELQRTDLFDKSATIYLVTQIGITDLRNSNRLITRYSTSCSPKFEIVLNRYVPSSVGIDDEHISKALTKPAQRKIPDSHAVVQKAQNTATPFALESSPISQVVQQMVRSASGQLETPKKKKWFHFFS